MRDAVTPLTAGVRLRPRPERGSMRGLRWHKLRFRGIRSGGGLVAYRFWWAARLPAVRRAGTARR